MNFDYTYFFQTIVGPLIGVILGHILSRSQTKKEVKLLYDKEKRIRRENLEAAFRSKILLYGKGKTFQDKLESFIEIYVITRHHANEDSLFQFAKDERLTNNLVEFKEFLKKNSNKWSSEIDKLL